MIYFQKIRWKNFLATGNTFIEIEFDKSKTSIMLGPSGSGKSTLLDAICFALFGRAFRNIKKEQLVNSINEKDCLVEIFFKIGTKNYIVRRGIKPNIFEIYKNDKMIEQDASVHDYQQKLEKQILKFNRKTFTQIVVLGASNFTPFMQLKPSDRRTIIEELLDIEIFSVMNVLLKERYSKLKDEITHNANQIEILENKIEIHEEYVKNLARDKNTKILNNEAEIEKNLEQVEQLKAKCKSLLEEINVLRSGILDVDKVSKSISQFNDLKNQIERNIKKTEKEVEFYETNDDCPTCKQPIDDDFKVNEVAQKNVKLDEFNSGISQIEDNLSNLSSRLEQIKKAQDIILDKERELVKSKSSISGVESYVEKLLKENEELKKPKKKIADERDSIKQMKSEKKDCISSAEQFAYRKALYDTGFSLLKDGGIKSRIIKQYLPLINKYVNKYLNSMNFFVSFHLDEEFNESIKSRGRDIFSYENFSEGEKQRIDLALLFTWRVIARMKNSVNTNLLIMDEVFDSYLDNAATENVIELLNSDLFSKTNIFVISHKDTIADKFDRQLKFNKVKSFSRIE